LIGVRRRRRRTAGLFQHPISPVWTAFLGNRADREAVPSPKRVKRWKMGYGHKRSTKSKAQRQRLRTPTTVYKAYARVMKKLGMKGF